MALLEPRYPLLPQYGRFPLPHRAPSFDPSSPVSDASQRRSGPPASYLCPSTTEELAQVLAWHHHHGHRVVLAGARTGLVGGAVPEAGDHVVSLERARSMRLVSSSTGAASLWVQAGASLYEIREFLANEAPSLFFPPDPTETSASIGGMAATNASGARSLRYGPTRRWTSKLVVVLADGGILELQRASVHPAAGPISLRDATGKTRQLHTELIPKPATKNSLGYHVDADSDLVDLFVGAEGTLGAIVELELELLPRPHHVDHLIVPLSSEAAAVGCVRWLRQHQSATTVALEYFDSAALTLAADRAPGELVRSAGPSGAAIYVELESAQSGADEPPIELLTQWLIDNDEDPERVLIARNEHQIGALRQFRHAVPERINALIAKRAVQLPELHKIATDMAVPLDALPIALRRYREVLSAAALEYVIFGHIGDGHLHVNVLPRGLEEIAQARSCYRALAAEVVRLGGAVAAEHGIGRLKKDLLAIQYPPVVIERMRKIKSFFDPLGMLNRGVLWD